MAPMRADEMRVGQSRVWHSDMGLRGASGLEMAEVKLD